MNIYFDNAATTPIDPEVIAAMIPVLENNFGNHLPFTVMEKARKRIAAHFNASPAEFFFTSGGTEADNMILRCAVEELGVTQIITSPLEHHAVLHTAEEIHQSRNVKLKLVKVDEKGKVDLNHLKELLQTKEKTLVSLMHANNEIASMISLEAVGNLCKEYSAYFHSDTVQTIGHYAFDFKELNIDFATCSAHKFNGPKGIGFIYINSAVKLKPFITGGAQERNMRAGTENIYGIVGLAKALDLAYENLEKHQKHIRSIKQHMIQSLTEAIPEVKFNGDCESEDSLYTVLNVCFPSSTMNEMFLYHLDIEGISISGGSACSSGTDIGSHVLRGINTPMDRPSVRFSFGRFNKFEEVNRCVAVLKSIYE